LSTVATFEAVELYGKRLYRPISRWRAGRALKLPEEEGVCKVLGTVAKNEAVDYYIKLLY